MGKLTQKILLFICLSNFAVTLVYSQGVQAVKNLSSETEEISPEEVRRGEDKLLAAQKLGYYNTIFNVPPYSTLNPEISSVIKEANDVINTRITNNYTQFDIELAELNRAEGVLVGTASAAIPVINLNIPQQAAGVAGVPIPGSSILVPDIVFSLGPELNAFNSNSIYSFGISSNLLGAVVGTAFDALGSTALKEYFSENISIGTAIPFGEEGNLTTQLGLGLGGINFNNITIWPVLHIETINAEDTRVPPGLEKIQIDTENWSSPILSIGILPFKQSKVQQRLQEGKIVPIPVIGLRLPFYYPGSQLGSLAALFTENKADYRRSGGLQLILGVTFPLLKIKP